MNDLARILVVDDEESIRRTTSITLERAGYLVDTAENGKKAIEKCERNFYNLALLDIRLPDMEGTELLTALKDTTPGMVKIILTGFPGLENAITAINKGVDAYLIKPVNTNELLRVIKETLQKQREEEQFTQKKLEKFVETRLKVLQAEELERASASK